MRSEGYPCSVPGGEAQSQSVGQLAYPELQDLGLRMRGVTAGLVVFGGVAIANAANAAFNLVAGRWLGPGRYSDLAALLAVLGLISFPLGAAQYNIASWVAAFAARGNAEAVARLSRRGLTVAVGFGVLVAALLLAASVAIRNVLGVGSLGAVLLVALCAVPAACTPSVLGLAQGLERFFLFSWAQALGPLVRVAVLPFALAAGFGVAGAMGATLVGTTIGVAAGGLALRSWFPPLTGPAPIARRDAVRAIAPVTLGIVALTSLTTIDVVVAKLTFDDSAAGVYGGASLVARLILYVPAAIASVLLPKVSSRAASGRGSQDIVVKSLVTTAALCVVATGIYSLAPKLLLEVAFGAKYTSADSFLWLFGIAMTCWALVNVLFVYHIARKTRIVPFMLGAGALVEIALFGVAHGSPRQLLAVSTAVAIALLAALLAVTRGPLRHPATSRE